jgi:Fe2+-dicitrate sensor, membrane component
MQEERAWYLLSLQLADEASPEELEELRAILQSHPELDLRAQIMQNIWRSQHPQTQPNEHFNKHLQRLSNHLSTPVLQFEKEPQKHTYRWLWMAAGAAASIIIVLLLWMPAKQKAKALVANNVVSTRPGSKSKVELPDGTQVWLNANSRITYNQNFMDSTREVQLTGEAYFDVASMVSEQTGKKIPFIIHTHSIDVKVLGTAFNVRSYPDEKTTQTALIHGSIEVTLHNNPDKKIILKPSEKLVVRNDDSTMAINATNDDQPEDEPMMTLSKIKPYKGDTATHFETMWLKNKLAFENESFDNMLREIERWYNVTVVLRNESLKNLHFTGVFEEKSLNEVMEALSFSWKFHYEIKNGQLIIW